MDARRIGSALSWRTRRYVNRVRARVPHTPYPTILLYHRIEEDAFDPWGDVVAPRNFRQQIEWLAANRALMHLSEFVDRHRTGSLPNDAIAITIDDGYSCVSEIAAPLLERARVPATVFVSPEIIRKGAFWWNELQSIILGYDGELLEVDGREVPLGAKSSNDQFWLPRSPPSTPRQRAYVQIQTMLSRLPPDELDPSMATLRRIAPPEASPTKRPMSADEVGRTASDLMEFGSHSLTHAWLPGLSDDVQKREIEGSVEQCEKLTGRRPTAFAYPYGMFDERAKAKVAAAGFDCACTTQNLAVSTSSPTYALPRLTVGNWDAASLDRALNRLCLA